MDLTRRLPERGSAPAFARSERLTLGLFLTTVFLSAGLIFAIEPMVAKMLLPSFGGASSVWAVSLVFFQAVLLAGYTFAHVSLRSVGVRRQAVIQLGLLLLPFAALPVAVGGGFPGVENPSIRLLVVLAAGASLPFFAVTTAGPVLQRWFSATGHSSGGDPYFLYAASNAGSLLGLLLYPILIERSLPLAEQARAWAIAYGVFVVLSALCAWRVFTAPAVADARHEVATASTPIAWRTRLGWIAMGAIPSSLMVGTTTHLSTDVAAMPMLWVIPLALYLLTFVVAFARRELLSLDAISRIAVVTSLAAVCSLLPTVRLPIWALVVIHGVNLLVLALLVHRRLALGRPPASRLTEFYLLLSLGGVCGGAFNALLAPVIFENVAEYPIAIVAALALRPRGQRRDTSPVRRIGQILVPFVAIWATLGAATQVNNSELVVRAFLLTAVVMVVLSARRPTAFAVSSAALLLLTIMPHPALHGDRTFYGVLRVEQNGTRHNFVHGTTVHGVQDFAPGKRREPLSYHTRQGPLGQLFERMGGELDDVAIVGLGAGAIAAYGDKGDRFTFFEIDPEVARVAENPRYFTYLSDSAADIDIVVGDGRLKLDEMTNASYDAIVLDAFSSDSVPVHLLTSDAFEMYLRKLRPDGILAVHISNRYLDLKPVVTGIARHLGLTGVSQERRFSRADYERNGRASSHWVMLARDPAQLEKLQADKRWQSLPSSPGLPVWTDQSSNILDAMRWFH